MKEIGKSKLVSDKSDREFDLEDRLIDFAVDEIKLAESFPKSYAGNHLGGQLIRSTTSAALNYGEAQSAESRKDFIHKIKIVLKELRESRICLRILKRIQSWNSLNKINPILKECNELISIFVASISTTEGKMRGKKT